MQWFI